MAHSITWNLSAVENEGLEKGLQRVLAINWIVGAITEGDPIPDMGVLLTPWRWSVDWKLYHKTGNHFQEYANATITTSAAVDVQKADAESLRQEIEKEMVSALKELTVNAFSLDARFALSERGGPVSIVAAIAGLSHAPAAISGSILKLSDHVVVTFSDETAYGKTFALVPQIKVGELKYESPSKLAAPAMGDVIQCDYSVQSVPTFRVFLNSFEIRKDIALKREAAEDSALTPAFINWCATNFNIPRLVGVLINRDAYVTGQLSPSIDLARNVVRLLLETIWQALSPSESRGRRTLLHDLLNNDWDGGEKGIDRVERARDAIHAHLLALGEPVTKKKSPATVQFLENLKGKSGPQFPVSLKDIFNRTIDTVLAEADFVVRWDPEKPDSTIVEALNNSKHQAPLLFAAVGGNSQISYEDSALAGAVFLIGVLKSVGDPLTEEAVIRDRQSSLLPLLLRNALGHRENAKSFLGALFSSNYPKLHDALDAALKLHQELFQLVALSKFHLISPDDVWGQLTEEARRRITSMPNTLTSNRHDLGVELVMPGSTRTDDGFKSRRGYAIALGVGLYDDDKGKRVYVQGDAEWITKSLAMIRRNDPFIRDSRKVDLWLQDTCGAVRSQGVSTVWIVYDGSPKNAVIGKAPLPKDFPDFKPAMYRLWPSDQIEKLPIVGYGLTYKSIAVGVDNAGGAEIRSALVDEGVPTIFHDAQKALDANAGLVEERRFLSVERVGGPAIDFPELVKASEIAADSFCYLWLAQKPDSDASHNRPLVAMLAPGPKERGAEDFLAGVPSSCSFTMHAPKVHAKYLVRWLNFEKVVRALKGKNRLPANTKLSDERLSKVSDDDLLNLIRALNDDAESSNTSSYVHPGVSRFRIVAEFGPEKYTLEKETGDIYPGEKDFWKALDPKVKRSISHTVEVNRAISNNVEVDGAKFVVTVAPASFVKLTMYAGIHDRFLKGDAARIDLRVAEQEGVPSGQFYYFEGATTWLESINWTSVPSSESLEQTTPHLKPAELDISTDRVRAVVGGLFQSKGNGGDSRYISWAKGLTVSRHEWHWVGPPIDPEGDLSGASSADWLHAYANVASLRQQELAILHAQYAKGEWTVPKRLGVLKEIELPRTRGARHMAFSVSLSARFRPWLKKSTIARLETPVWTYGTVILGRQVAKPDIPKWQLAVPLGETRVDHDLTIRQSGQSKRAPNGVLLVFSEAIFRTDSLSNGGGIGEAIDIDVVATWAGHQQSDGKLVSLAEIGPNPIFERKPPQPRMSSDTFVITTRPFGLTNDIGANPLITGTAVIASAPPSYVGETWVLAKLRARKLIWPHMLLDNELVAEDGGYRLKRDPAHTYERLSDFAVYGLSEISETGPRKFELSFGGIAVEIFTPRHPNQELRLLATLHKARWRAADSVASWRWQFTVYEATKEAGGYGDWKPVLKIAPPQTADIPATEDLVLKVTGLDKPIAYKLLASDYSEARWVSFIGLLGNGKNLGSPAHDFRIAKTAKGDLMLQRIDRGVWIDEPNFNLTSPEELRSTCFQLLLIYRPTRDALRGYLDRGAGIPLGFWKPEVVGGQLKGFKPALAWTKPGLGPLSNPSAATPQPNDQAYIISFQRRNAGTVEPFPSKWDDFMNAMFPIPHLESEEPSELQESSLRMLPQYLGPIPVDDRPH